MNGFRVDIGLVKVLGVTPLNQHSTCIAGLSCRIEGITGEGLSDSDQVLVMETCGRPAHVFGFPGFGFMQDVSRTRVTRVWFLSKDCQTYTWEVS